MFIVVADVLLAMVAVVAVVNGIVCARFAGWVLLGPGRMYEQRADGWENAAHAVAMAVIAGIAGALLVIQIL